jgi:hypothetical protein
VLLFRRQWFESGVIPVMVLFGDVAGLLAAEEAMLGSIG